MRKFRTAMAAALAAALVAGCTSGWGEAQIQTVRYIPPTAAETPSGPSPDCVSAGGGPVPSSEPLLDQGEAAFAGLLRDGRGATPAGVTRYIFHTHGMGVTKRCEFYTPLLQLLHQRGYRLQPGSRAWWPAATRRTHHVRGEALDCRGGAALLKPCAFSDFGDYRIDRLLGPGGDRVVVYSYYWHEDLWRVQFPFLKDDLAQKPGWLAAVLKHGTMDGGLSDAAAYLGPMGGPLREGMGTVVCEMLREAAGQSGAAPAGLASCLASAPTDQVAASARFGFLSHSLGSRMLFDVLSDQDPDAPAAAPPEGFAYQFAAAQTATFFMAANQLPLLGPGRVTVSPNAPPVAMTEEPCGRLPGFLALRCRLQTRHGAAAFPPLDVVGFFDPGDLLGYRVSGGMTDENQDGIRFVTVEHRNTPQILFLGSWPLEAHDQELQRDSASALILCGGVVRRGRLQPRDCGVDQ